MALNTTNGIKYGDVNGDGEVDLNDALILKRYIAEQNPHGFNTANSDVNADNETDMSDLLMLKKYLAEWNVRLGPEILTVRFYDGDTLIDTLVAYKGYPLSEVPSSLKTSKANAVFEGWYTDRACTVPFYADAPVTENMSVWAKYDELEGTSLTVTSFAQTDITHDAEFKITGEGDITAVTLVSKDGSDPVALSISGNSPYTVKAKDGFKKGASYELTLPEGLNFIDSDGNEMPDTVRTAYFTVAKEAVNNIKISGGVHYVKNADPSKLKEGDKITLDGVAAGELICFYKTVNPKDRDYKSGNAYANDPETWFKAGDVSEGSVTLKKLEESDSEKIYDVPDNFPVIGALPQGNGGTLTLAEDGDGYTLDVNLYAYMTEEKDDATVEYANSRVSVGDFV